jgi:hypothetical protein
VDRIVEDIGRLEARGDCGEDAESDETASFRLRLDCLWLPGYVSSAFSQLLFLCRLFCIPLLA